MTREEAIKDIQENIKPFVGGKSLDMAIEALEMQNLCAEMLESAQPVSTDGDLISRQDAIEAVAKAKAIDPFGRYDKQNIGVDWALDALSALPSAEAVKGYTEWLEHLIVDTGNYELICEDAPDPEWCEVNCHYPSIQAGCLRHIYETIKGGDDE